MTDPKHPERSVLDPEWETALRRGQEAEGEAGSVDAELAIVHLLRHARQPEGLDDARLDAVWGDVAGQASPAPWWKRSWMLWAPVAAAAAVAVFVIVKPPEGEAEVAVAEESTREHDAAAPLSVQAETGEDKTRPSPAGAASTAAPNGNAALLERQFSLLEPKARAELGANIETERGSLRYGLLDSAKGAGR